MVRPAKLERALHELARAKSAQVQEAAESKKRREEMLLSMMDEARAEYAGLKDSMMQVKKRMRSLERAIDEIHPRATLADVVAAIRRGNVVTLAGAGISVSAGIPDFRTPNTGLYDNLARYNLPYPEAVFELSYFRNNPEPFHLLACELYPDGRFRPTPTHHFIRLLEEKGLLLRHFTQNIDGLERLANVSPAKIVEAHGGFSSASCIDCSAAHVSERFEQALKQTPPSFLRCETGCGGLVKPDIVFFGESLPERFYQCIRDVGKAGVVLVLGTSLVVAPFATLPDRCHLETPRLLINREVVGSFGLRRDDVCLLGECDAMVGQLVEALGWTADWELLMSRGK